MKKLMFSSICVLMFGALKAQTKVKATFNDTLYLKPIEVSSLRAGEKSPFAKTNLSAAQLQPMNLGVDLPVLLSNTPSAIFTSDAGNGVGYTGLRIRGTDASRINVTINGIPYNDAESQGTFFVNIPDFVSSANSIQIQRGVGTSTNGAGAFGATVNVATNELHDQLYASFSNSAGSYNTWKNNFQFGSGLIGKHFTIDGRLSRISSDGYVDRASSDLKSYYFSTAYTDAKNSVRFNIFSGKEKTYQAWNGIDAATLATNRTYNPLGMEQPGKPYADQTDNYTQTHYQLFLNRQLNPNWKGNIAFFLTKGKGYYEEYRANQDLADYQLPNYDNGGSIVTATDLIRQLWLDNQFYGSTWSLQCQKNNHQITLGGAYTMYDGHHFGRVKWAAVQAAAPLNFEYYRLQADKNDFSVYAKWSEQWSGRWHSYLDVQVRKVHYTIEGFRKNPDIRVAQNYGFINPKIGVVYAVNNWQWYGSFAVASKEPNREDFESGISQLPKPETLLDWEFGVERKHKTFAYSANLYYMRYVNQLVLTGKINDVGAYTRTNIAASYRLGIELQAKWQPAAWFNATGNLTFSENKALNFTEYIDDYDNGGQASNFYKKTTIGFSPAVTGGTQLNFIPMKNAEIALINRYVSKQYLDNTGQQSRSIDPYFVQDIRLSYQLDKKFFRQTNFYLQLNNVFNSKYVSNGYSFSYIYGGLTTENYYFPMAPFNIMAGITVNL